jgi:hypothetical protein
MSKKFGIQTKGTGRAVMQAGGVPPVAGAGGMAPVGGAARRDMRSGYYPSDMGMRGGPMYNKGGRVGLRDRAFRKGGKVNTSRENRLEELGRVDAERGRTRKGKKNLREEKSRIVRELGKRKKFGRRKK